MKLVAARIRNFKLLRHIDLDFANELNHPLTVVRAENGSGKTSMLQALRWGLFGNEGLEDSSVRLSPADWPEGVSCDLSVEIDFVHTQVSVVGDTQIKSETRYILKREVIETPRDNEPNRTNERISLYEKKESGADPVDAPESRIRQMLPPEMIDIFFTDGDAAMSFISPQLTETTKRDQVKDAIRSLLGLGLLEAVQKRIKDGHSAVNRKISRAAGSEDLSQISTDIEVVEERRDKLQEEIDDLNHQIENTNQKLDDIKKQLSRALEAGSYETLLHQLEKYETELKEATAIEGELKKRHQQLFESEALSWGLLQPTLEAGLSHLDDLHAKGEIPKAALPVLRERLELNLCICKTDLSEGTQARQNVLNLIDQQKESDVHTEYLSDLYFVAKANLEKWHSSETEQWEAMLLSLQTDRLLNQNRMQTASDELATVNAKIDQIDQQEIEDKRQMEKTLISSLTQKTGGLEKNKIYLADVEQKLKQLKRDQDKLIQEDHRVTGLKSEQQALTDLSCIVDGALEDMQGTYLTKVSNRMNDMFLEMIGADPEHGAIYQGTEITPDYSIIVRTFDERTLNPDHEVNGASQRALTFAFIWALTEVSGVVAPRVIDTPLGMMSGLVKHRVLSKVAQPAGIDEPDRQVILFLTQSEISNTEDILDERAGKSVTLTKTDDYPADLVNDPYSELPEIQICACNHRQYCKQCQRKNYQDFNLTARAV